MATPAELFGEVMGRVLVPAVSGGALRIGRPFGRKRAKAAASVLDRGGGTGLAELRAHLGAPSVGLAAESGGTSIDAADATVLLRIRRMTAADPAAIGPRLDGAVVELAALFHDLLAVYHPDLVSFIGRSRPRKLLEATAKALAEVEPPETVREAVLRHAWLGDLPRFTLTRTEVKWWTGSWRSVGRQPPPRLLAWPDVRRVRRDDKSVELARAPELFGDRGELQPLAESFAHAMSAFFAATPLTDLTQAGRFSPPFRWTPVLDALVRTSAGARVARRAIGLGEAHGKFALDVLAAVGPAAERVLGGPPLPR